MKEQITHIAVLIPARDEEALLPRCIASVLQACLALPAQITYEIVIVVDSSSDGTLEIAKRMLSGCGRVLVTSAGSVGVARSLAAKAALNTHTGDLRQCWLANTDADCEVPEDWLLQQLKLARTGAQAVAGIVDVEDFSDHLPGVDLRFRETYLINDDGSHQHVHGANIGMRADVYLQAGGWSEHRTAEDHDLWNRLTLSGCRKHSVAQLKVLTSGRRVGRAPNGFAAALAAHNEALV